MGNQIRREDSDAAGLMDFWVEAPGIAAGSRVGRWAATAFPFVLWAFATCYFGGDLGKWADDYTNGVRSNATGQYTWPDLMSGLRADLSRPYRPLLKAWLDLKATVLWNHSRIDHLLTAATHGVAALLFWRLLLDMTRCRRAAALAALLFLICPLHDQVALCSAGQITSISTVLFLLLLGVLVRFARGQWGWLSLVPMFGLAYMIPTFQEQPATGVAALPLLYMAVCPREQKWRTRAMRALVPTAVCGVALLTYLVRWQMNPQVGLKGGPGSWITPESAPARLLVVGQQILNQYAMRDVLAAGFPLGWQCVGTALGVGWITLVAIAGGAWWLRYSTAPTIDAEGSSGKPNVLWAGLFALIAFFLAWLPIALQCQVSVESRMCYYPLMVALLLLALIFSGLTSGLRRWKLIVGGFNLIVVGVVLWACLYGAVCFVAMQFLYRERYRLDQDEIAQIRSLLPNPEPGTIFVPLDIRDAPARTGHVWFDHTARSALEMFWVTTPIFRQTYRMGPLFGTHFIRWLPIPLSGANETSVRYALPGPERYMSLVFKEDPAGGLRLPWARMVPFVIDEQGQVALVSNIRVQRVGAKDLELSFDQVRAALRRNQQPERWFTLQDSEVSASSERIGPWWWESTGQAVSFTERQEWQVGLQAVSMHPPYPGGLDTGSMRAVLTASTKQSRLHLQATFTEWSIVNRPWGDGIEVVLYLDGQKEAPLGILRVTPKQVDLEKRWMPISVDIPPLSRPRTLYLEVRPGPAGDVSYDGCCVTSGFREYLGPAGATSSSSPSSGIGE